MMDSYNQIGIHREVTKFQLPKQLEGVATATILDTNGGEILVCHDPFFIYATNISNIRNNNILFQKFSLPKVQAIFPIIKNYLLVISQNNLVVFQMSITEESKLMLKFTFNWKPFKSYFLREVVENMAELQIFQNDIEASIFQFTVNGKMGHMAYSLTPQFKIKNTIRNQLYGSKTFFNNHKKSLYYLKSFSDKAVNLLPVINIQKQLCTTQNTTCLGYVSVSKTQEHFMVLGNQTVVSLIKSDNRHKITCRYSIPMKNPMYLQFPLSQRNPFEDFNQREQLKSSVYFDQILVQDERNQISYIYHIKASGSALVAVQHGKYQWFWTSNRRIVGISYNRTTCKIVHTLKINQKDQNEIDSPTKEQKKGLNIFENQRNDSNSREDFKKAPINKDKHEEDQNEDVFKFILKSKPEKNDKREPQVELQRQMLYKQTLIKGEQNIAKSEIERKRQKSGLKKQEVKPQGNNQLSQAQSSFISGIQYERFKPTKIIQRNKTSISKTIQKSKEIEPLVNKSIEQKGQSQSSEIQQNKQIGLKGKQIKETIEQKASQSQTTINQIVGVDEKIESIQQPSGEQNAIQNQKNQQSQSYASPAQNQEKAGDNLEKNEPIHHISQNDVPEQERQADTDNQIKIDKQQTHNVQNEEQLKEKVKNEIDSQKVQETSQLPKSHALIIGKMNFKEVEANPLNLFNTSINRNKIFSSLKEEPDFPLKSHKSQQEYYNPFQTSRLGYSKSLFTNARQQLLPTNIQEMSRRALSKPVRVEVDIPRTQNNSEDFFKLIKGQFEKTTTILLRSIQDISNQNNNDVYIKKKLEQQIQQTTKQNVKNFLAGEMMNRLDAYFKQIFSQSSKAYSQTLQYYKKETNLKVQKMDVQFTNQQKIFKDIKDIDNNLRFSIQNLKQESQQTTHLLFKSWNKQVQETNKSISNLIAIQQKIQQQEQERLKRYEDTKKSLESIKNMLVERANAQEVRKQELLERKAQKEKQQLIRKEKKKKAQKKSKSKLGDAERDEIKQRRGRGKKNTQI